MQAIIRKDKQTGEMYVEYYKVADKAAFRYDLLKKIIGGESDITVIIDTNQHVSKKPGEEIENFLKQSDIPYLIKPTALNELTVLGLYIKKKKKKYEKMIVLQITSGQFTRELFHACLENYDIAMGIGKKKPFDEIYDDLILNPDEVLFDRLYFRESIYDSFMGNIQGSLSRLRQCEKNTDLKKFKLLCSKQ